MAIDSFPPGFADLLQTPFVDALFGRRSRRFAMGAAIPNGPLAFQSCHEPFPLTELERMLVLTATAGNTGWHFMHMHHPGYAPALPNYAATAGGRTFPSTAGWHTTELFFTDDSGVYFFATRDAPGLTEPVEGTPDVNALLEAHRDRLHKLSDQRLQIPPAYIAGHNTWIANHPGSLLIIPVADVAQHLIADLCYGVQNGGCIYDDVHGEAIPGIERFRHLVDVDHPGALSVVEQGVLTECAAELSTSCFAGMLMLQAMGLGGWLYDGIDRFALLGASGDPAVPGLGFRYDRRGPNWPVPNATGLPGVFEGFCPPHYPNMRAAVEAFVQRKFGPGGPFHPDTPGPWQESAQVRSSAQVYTEEFIDCVALMAQYIYDRFGKFPGTVPTLSTLTYLQAHHLDLEFYDQHFKPGAYLPTHAQHMARWHPETASGYIDDANQSTRR